MADLSVVKETTYQQLLAEHRELRRATGGLRAFLEGPRPDPGAAGALDWATDLSRRLVDLHAQLAVHFREEETTELFPALTAAFPQTASEVREFAVQHRLMLGELRTALTEVLRFAEALPDSGSGLRRRLQHLLGRLAEHEAAETDLIQRLSCQDYGPAD